MGNEHSIWWEMAWFDAASPKQLERVERRLGVTLPPRLKAQLRIQNGGELLFSDWYDLAAASPLSFLADATVDGILPVEDWELASERNGFPSVEGRGPLVVIAGHAEDQLCLDYRASGPHGEPGLVALFVMGELMGKGSWESVTAWVESMVDFKQTHEPPEGMEDA